MLPLTQSLLHPFFTLKLYWMMPGSETPGFRICVSFSKPPAAAEGCDLRGIKPCAFNDTRDANLCPQR